MNMTQAEPSEGARERWHAIGVIALGAVFLAAAAGKLLHIYDFRATMGVLVVQVLGKTSLPLTVICAWSVITLVAVETGVGLGLVVFRSLARLWVACAAVLLVGFSGALGLMLVMDHPPSCVCFGSWDVLRGEARTGAILGLVRNGALLALCAWLLGGVRRVAAAPVPGPRSRGGFTLVELLVVIAVVAVLVAILLPTLSGAKKTAKSSRVLSALAQCHASIAQYATEERDYFPYLARVGMPESGALPDADWGDLGAPSYFRGQGLHWPTALLAHGVDLSNLPFTERPREGPPRISTYLWMTNAAFARPEYWVGTYPPDSFLPAHFAGVRQSEAVFPSNKGLLASVGVLDERTTSWEVGACDGSAAIRSLRDPPLQIEISRPYGCTPWRVVSTFEGIRGRDY
ncbi:MAG: prepilin-type N-terminal cleavage/methylation domain-containing protein [Phycisphaerales bacterium]|jgi:prepilin-type N-terminal cleavage/methylation domain-containing protein|nr:prepilin-type N-terminal cleavage/methylation domain-containing protein [Phycisphaerales bacterium]